MGGAIPGIRLAEGHRPARRWLVGFLVAVAVTASACGGGGDETGGDTSAEDSASTTAAPTSQATTTTEETTTSEATTTMSEATTTTTEAATLADVDREQHLAAALLTADDLPDYLLVDIENETVLGGALRGDLTLAPCGVVIDEPKAGNAKNSIFRFDPNAAVPPDGVIIIAHPIVRWVGDDAGGDLLSDFRTAADRCLFEDVETAEGLRFGGPSIAVEARDGVRGVGGSLLDQESQIWELTYVFEAGPLDAALVLLAAAPEADGLFVLVDPVVAAFQDRLAACVAEPDVCSAPV